MGNWQTAEYDSDLNDTIKGLTNTNSANRNYILPNGTGNQDSNNKIRYIYTVSGIVNNVNLNSWRNTPTVPFTFGGKFRSSDGMFIISPKVYDNYSVEIGTVQYRGIYNGGAYRGAWLPANSYGTDEYLIPLNVGSMSLTAMSLKVDFRYPSMLSSVTSTIASYLPFTGYSTSASQEENSQQETQQDSQSNAESQRDSQTNSS